MSAESLERFHLARPLQIFNSLNSFEEQDLDGMLEGDTTLERLTALSTLLNSPTASIKQHSLFKIKDKILTDIKELQNGNVLTRQIFGFRKGGERIVSSLLRADILTTQALVSCTLEKLQKILHGILSPFNSELDLASTIKLRANLSCMAMVPGFAIEILASIPFAYQSITTINREGIHSLFDLAVQDEIFLRDAFFKKIKSALGNEVHAKAIRDEIATLETRLQDYMLNNSKIFSMRKLTTYSMELHKALRKNDLAQALTAAIKIWVNLAKISAGSSSKQNNEKSKICQCEWESSIFSEKAYLIYLANTFGYTIESINHKFHIDLVSTDNALPEPTNCFNLSKIQRAIVCIQEDLRKRPNQQLQSMNLDEPQKVFLKYDEWVAHELHRAFPENNFEKMLYSVEFPLFPSLNKVYNERESLLIDFCNRLEESMLSVRIGASIWASYDELYDTFPTDRDKATRKRETLLVAKKNARGRDTLSNTEVDWNFNHQDIYLREFHNWSRAKLLRGYKGEQALYDQQDQSIFLDITNAIKALSHVYNQLLGAAESGLRDNQWAVAIGLISGENESDTAIENLSVRSTLARLRDILSAVVSSSYGATLGLNNTIEDDYAQILTLGVSAYNTYKNTLNRFNIANHDFNIKMIVQSLLLIRENLQFPFNEQFFPREFPNVAQRYLLQARLSRALGNIYRLQDNAKGILESYDKDQAEASYVNSFYVFKNRDEDFPNFRIYDLLDRYDSFYYSNNEYDSNEDGYVTAGLNANKFLSTPDSIKSRLILSIVFSDGKRINWTNLAQLFYNLLSHLPYIKYFLIPVLHAKHALSENDHHGALVWLSMIFDYLNMVQAKFITPFLLTKAEQNYIKLLLAEIWLDQAEVLFRENSYESIQHAKELYQKILKLFEEYNCCEEVSKPQRNLFTTLTGKIDSSLRDQFTSLLSKSTHVVSSNESLQARIKALGELAEQGQKDEITTEVKSIVPTIIKLLAEDNVNRTLKPLGNFNPVSFEIENMSSMSSGFLTNTHSFPEFPPIGSDIVDELMKNKQRLLEQFLSKLDVPRIDFPPGPIELPIVPPDIPPYVLEPQTPVRYNLCLYPNPKIIRIVSTACKLLRYIQSCRNFFGLHQDDISIYTYSSLLQKSRYYLQIALNLEKDFLVYQQNFNAEQQTRLKALQSVLVDKGKLTLGNLMISEAYEEKKFAMLQLDRATIAQQMMQKDLAHSRSPWGTFTRLHNTVVTSAGRGNAASSGNPYAAAAIAAVDTIVSLSNWGHEDAMLDMQMKMLDTDVDIARQNVSLTDIKISIANTQQEINRIESYMDTSYLQFLYNKELNAEDFLYMATKAKALYKDYVDMATRFAWLAERQLEFSRGVAFNTIRFNYYSSKQFTKLTGLLLAAETLQKDIDSLNFQRELSEQNPIRIKKTISLRKESPFLFNNFLAGSGNMLFSTSSDYFALDRDGTRLVYKGHTRRPDYFGHLQQRIDSIELRLIGLIGSDEDIKIRLTNFGNSIVLTEQLDELSQATFVPVRLKRPLQKIVFSRSLNQDTANVYAFTALDGILKPFETIGLDSLWEISLDPLTNPFDLSRIYDIQLIINYDTKYSRLYEATQRENTKDLPLSRNKTFSLKYDFPNTYYKLQNPVIIRPGFRDLRFADFIITSDLLGPNERDQTLQSCEVYAHSDKDLSNSAKWRISTQNTKPPLFFTTARTDFKKQLMDGNNQLQLIKGMFDTTKAGGGLGALLPEQNKAISRKWSIKFFAEESPNSQYHKKDLLGHDVNTRGISVPPNVDGSDSPSYYDIVQMKTGAKRNYSLNLQKFPNVQEWLNYRFQVKTKIKAGNTHILWRHHDHDAFVLTLSPSELNKQAKIGSMQADVIQYFQEFDMNLVIEEWYQIECLSYQDPIDLTRAYVELKIDDQLIWAGFMNHPLSNNSGAITLCVEGQNAEAKFDDLLVERVDLNGKSVKELYIDTFNGKKSDYWTHDPALAENDFARIVADSNTALNLEDIQDVLFSMEYSYK